MEPDAPEPPDAKLALVRRLSTQLKTAAASTKTLGAAFGALAGGMVVGVEMSRQMQQLVNGDFERRMRRVQLEAVGIDPEALEKVEEVVRASGLTFEAVIDHMSGVRLARGMVHAVAKDDALQHVRRFGTEVERLEKR